MKGRSPPAKRKANSRRHGTITKLGVQSILANSYGIQLNGGDVTYE